MLDLTDKIIAYESNELSTKDTIKLFSELVKSKQDWSLQGHYCRTAQYLIDNDILDESGKINHEQITDGLII